MTQTKSDRPTVTIGFQVPDDDVDSLTGYCVAKMVVDDANANGRLPAHVAY